MTLDGRGRAAPGTDGGRGVGRLPTNVRLWHVTLTVGGEPVERSWLHDGLERLAHERPFLLSARYDARRAQVRYWEEARCVDDAAALALRLWGEHRSSAGLPRWQVIGLEVVDRDTYQWRMGQPAAAALVPAGGIVPFPD